MALRTAQSVVTTGTTPAVISPPTTSDTIAQGDFGPYGIHMRVTTTGTLTNVSVADPNVTAQGNPGTVTAVACPATGVRVIFIPLSAVSAATGVATVAFTSVTGVSVELYRA